jgi:hypothetical protein
MSHVFDSKAAMAQRTLLRRGAVALLAPLARVNGGYLQRVVGFAGITRTYTDEDGIQQLVKMMSPTPCIGVATGSRKFETLGIGGKQAMSECQVLLYFATQHSRDELIGRNEIDAVAIADDAANPGLDIMMEHAIELMHGSYPTLLTGTIKQCRIDSEEELVTIPEITVWLQTYNVKMQSYTGGREWRTAEQLLESIGWRLTVDPDEVELPDPPVGPTPIDFDTDVTP